MLKDRCATFVVVSRAPLAKFAEYQAQMGWSIRWFSAFGSGCLEAAAINWQVRLVRLR
jgi:predicted dithiol-disulfide oxidoreductase (DUF899 family)